MKPKIDIELELAEDEYELNRTQMALINQAQIVQEALGSLKADIERTQGMIAPTVEKVLNDALKPLLGTPAPNNLQPTGIIPSAGAGPWGDIVGQVISKLFGGQNSNSTLINFDDVRGDFEYYIHAMMRKNIRDSMRLNGLPLHELPSEPDHVHLAGT